MAEGRIQMLTHHTEDAVWQPRWLAHPNGARGLASLVDRQWPMSVRRRRATRASCIGRRSRRGQGRRCSSTAAGSIWSRARRSRRRCRRSRSRRCRSSAAYGVTVTSLDAVEATLRSGGLPSRRAGDIAGRAVPGGAWASGAWLFSEDSQARMFQLKLLRQNPAQPLRHRRRRGVDVGDQFLRRFARRLARARRRRS